MHHACSSGVHVSFARPFPDNGRRSDTYLYRDLRLESCLTICRNETSTLPHSNTLRLGKARKSWLTSDVDWHLAALALPVSSGWRRDRHVRTSLTAIPMAPEHLGYLINPARSAYQVCSVCRPVCGHPTRLKCSTATSLPRGLERCYRERLPPKTRPSYVAEMRHCCISRVVWTDATEASALIASVQDRR